MNKKWILLGAVAAVVLGTILLQPHWRHSPAAAPTTLVIHEAPGKTIVVSQAPAEIFRRAFWRHPTATDHIIHAERREWIDQGNVQRWQWFLQLSPSAELLTALRDGESFGLLRVIASRNAAVAVVTPDWFASATAIAADEVYQSPAGGLTIYYRAGDHMLFATDAGAGFAPPAALPERR
ncbi:MAG: hypothetical protein Q8M02_10320 [Candidatus Didemnitutus sp.]|nr:hypothetical protein [Candidatus Didemnitutus sp.]